LGFGSGADAKKMLLVVFVMVRFVLVEL
jgi:hypothetical protein